MLACSRLQAPGSKIVGKADGNKLRQNRVVAGERLFARVFRLSALTESLVRASP